MEHTLFRGLLFERQCGRDKGADSSSTHGFTPQVAGQASNLGFLPPRQRRLLLTPRAHPQGAGEKAEQLGLAPALTFGYGVLALQVGALTRKCCVPAPTPTASLEFHFLTHFPKSPASVLETPQGLLRGSRWDGPQGTLTARPRCPP